MADPVGDNDAGNARTKLMEMVAKQMDAIEADYGDGFEIDAAVTVVSVTTGGNTELRLRRLNVDPLQALGLLYLGQDNLREQITGAG